MNIKLARDLARLHNAPSDMVREEVFRQLKESQNGAWDLLINDHAVIKGIIKLAELKIIPEVSGIMEDGGWEELIGGSNINRGVDELKTNPATQFLVRTVLLVALALMGEGVALQASVSEQEEKVVL